jgi:hypothetical protein
MTLGEFYAGLGPFTATALLLCVPLAVWKLLELVADWNSEEA